MAAPKTVATYDLNGSTREFDFAFDYLARSFVKVSLIGTERVVLQVGTDYTFVSANRIRTNVIYGAPDYQQIEIRRETSTTDRLVDFQDASILRADDLDLSQLQVLHVAEEAREAATETIGTNNFGHLDARGRRIVNVADPVDIGDVVTRRWYEADVNGVYQNRVATEQARDKAREWATSQNQVEPGLESSKTYAVRAKASETAAAASAAASSNSAASSSASEMAASASAGSALNQAGIAEGHKNAAASSASAASSSANAASASASAALTQANRAKSEADRAETNATLVDTNFLRNRANHLGTQDLSTITGWGSAATRGTLDSLAPATGPGQPYDLMSRSANGLGSSGDLRALQNSPPSRFYGTGVMAGLCDWGQGEYAHMMIHGGWTDSSGRAAVQQVVHASDGIYVRIAASGSDWGGWKIAPLMDSSTIAWINGMSSRTWREVTRAAGTVYTNDTVCDIEVVVLVPQGSNTTRFAIVEISSDGVSWVSVTVGGDNSAAFPKPAGTCTVPRGHRYRFPLVERCWELRP